MDLLLSYMQQGLSFIGPFFILLGLLIFVHELGHFLVAKFFGVRVEVFSLGFGKKILQYKKGDTNYCLSVIPLGGYVKMFGSDPTQQVPEHEKQHSFLDKHVGARIAIVLAGPLMNLFFAAVLFAAIGIIGEQLPKAELGDIKPNTKAYSAGFRSGDEILKINNKQISHWHQASDLIKEHPLTSIDIEIKSVGADNSQVLKITPELVKNEDILSTVDKVGHIDGFTMESQGSSVGISNPDSIARQAGMGPMEIITKINGTEVNKWRDLLNLLEKEKSSPQLVIEAKSFSHLDKAESKIFTIKKWPPKNSINALTHLGFEPSELFLYKTVNNSPAQKVGLQSGDHILQINDQPINNWNQVMAQVKSYKKGSDVIRFVVQRNGQVKKFEVTPKMTELSKPTGEMDNRFTVGIVPAMGVVFPKNVTVKSPSTLAAVHMGIYKSWDWTKKMVISIAQIFQNRVSSKNIGGVITIGRIASKSFEVGLSSYLKFMAIISLNLFLINLLPIPILDGGHLVFFTIEALRGAPLSLKKMEIAQQVGLVILMTLMVFALFNDISNWINSPW